MITDFKIPQFAAAGCPVQTHDSDETHELLTALSRALLRHGRRKTQRRLMGVFVLFVVLCLGAPWLGRALEWPVAMPAAQVITPSVKKK
ncbi:hypothetical protein ALQ48_200049, partial [Pseudomonas coronafaciens pv. zizaniae]